MGGQGAGKASRQPAVVQLNRNTNWLDNPGVWTMYVCLLVAIFLILAAFLKVGMAWTLLHLAHNGITFFIFHWQKGSPIPEDQGKYDKLTYWEQMDDGAQFTRNKKFFTAVPVALFLLATHTTNYQRELLYVNTCALVPLLIGKVPAMHKVRIFGINREISRE